MEVQTQTHYSSMSNQFGQHQLKYKHETNLQNEPEYASYVNKICAPFNFIEKIESFYPFYPYWICS